jgi:TonB family protein
VLGHELLHIQRADYGVWMLARVACAFYWFHPLVWLAAARLRREAEQACDNGVLGLGAEPAGYAEQLVSLARGWSQARMAELAALAMAQSSHLEDRVRALLDPKRDRREVSSRQRLITALAAVLLLAPLAAVRAPAQAAAATLAGAVSDISGARLPHASLTLQRVGDTRQASGRADDAGEFEFRSLPPGEYSIEVKSPGFAIQRQTVEVASGERKSVQITLGMGSIAESVTVVGNSALRAGQQRASSPPRRIRVGGNVQWSKLITHIRPVYPEELQREGVEGMVVLEAVVLTDGSLGNLQVVHQLVDVDQRLVQAAMEAVRFWRYEPTLLNGVPVEVVTTVTVNFRLQP